MINYNNYKSNINLDHTKIFLNFVKFLSRKLMKDTEIN